MTLKAIATGISLALAALAPMALSQTAPTEDSATFSSLPAPLTETVSDFARVLDPEAEGRIASQLTALQAETGVQMMVVTMPSIDVYGGAGMRLDAFAKALFNAWGIGGADRNDGILMLVTTDAREVRIALGAGYDAVYDGRAARVLSTAVLPELMQNRLENGITAGIASSKDRLIAPFLAGQPVTVNEGFETPGSSLVEMVGGAAIFLGGAGFLIWRTVRNQKRCPRCGEATLVRKREVIEPATLKAAGTGIEHQHCTSCGFIDRKPFRIGRSQAMRGSQDRERLSSSGGGRFGKGSSGGSSSGGGSGGGKSSGGGASGKY